MFSHPACHRELFGKKCAGCSSWSILPELEAFIWHPDNDPDSVMMMQLPLEPELDGMQDLAEQHHESAEAAGDFQIKAFMGNGQSDGNDDEIKDQECKSESAWEDMEAPVCPGLSAEEWVPISLASHQHVWSLSLCHPRGCRSSSDMLKETGL